MGIVIRPSPAVFRRSMPLVVVFGAWRRFDIDPPLPAEDLDVITRVVGMARRFHMPLAFIRNVPADRGREAGVWLPGCRPRISDRVFDHPAGAPFRLEAFASPFNGLAAGEIHVVGPAGDSCMRAVFAAPRGDLGPIRLISPPAALHKCITAGPDADALFPPGAQSCGATHLSFESWEREVCEAQ